MRCNFFTYRFDWDSEDRLCQEQSDGLQLIPNLCLMQYLDNVKPSTKDNEEYRGHENLQVFTAAANPKLKKSLMAPRLHIQSSQKQTILAPEMTSEAILSHSPLFLGHEQTLKIHTKLTKITTTIISLPCDLEEKVICISENNSWSQWHFNSHTHLVPLVKSRGLSLSSFHLSVDINCICLGFSLLH